MRAYSSSYSNYTFLQTSHISLDCNYAQKYQCISRRVISGCTASFSQLGYISIHFMYHRVYHCERIVKLLTTRRPVRQINRWHSPTGEWKCLLFLFSVCQSPWNGYNKV